MTDEDSRLAERVQLLRKRKGWTVTEAARRAGMSASMLWKVENRQTSLTYQKLMRLAEGFEVDVAELFSVEVPDAVPGGRRVIERGDSAPAVNAGGNLHHFLATDIAQKHYFPIIVEVHAKPDDEQGPEAHGGEEFAYVIAGKLDFICEGYAPARLDVGDSVYFDASLKHRYVSVDEQGARILCVYSSPTALGSHSRAMQLLTKAREKTKTPAKATRRRTR